MKRTSTSQTGLSQLQDNERIAMGLIAGIVQSAGYYPDPVNNTSATFFAATTTSPVFASGQAITGTGASTANDSISVRYTTSGTDKVLNCTGNWVNAQQTWTNTLTVDTATKTLQCVLLIGTAAQPAVQLISGVTNLKIMYGVQATTSLSNNSVDTYLDAPAVSAGGYWDKVLSVKVTLSFVNPLEGQPGQPAVGRTIDFTRVISLMNKTGVNS
jgi:type IV pilus assembly protein PilW